MNRFSVLPFASLSILILRIRTNLTCFLRFSCIEHPVSFKLFPKLFTRTINLVNCSDWFFTLKKTPVIQATIQLKNYVLSFSNLFAMPQKYINPFHPGVAFHIKASHLFCHYYTPWKCYKSSGFLTFSGGFKASCRSTLHF